MPDSDLPSPLLQAQLDALAHPPRPNLKKELSELLGDASALLSYEVCTWWDGSYYCRNEQGRWEPIKRFS